MKKVTLLLFGLGLLLSTSSFAQNLKFGQLNMQELIALMPERDSAIVKLEKYGAELDETLQGMQTEFNTKLQTYNQKSATWTAAVLEAKTKELQEMRQRLEQFQVNAQNEYGQMQQELFAPVFKKANEAIEKLGKENGFTYIFDLSAGTVIFHSESTVDVLPLAKKALGIPASKTTPYVPASAQQQNGAQN